MNMKLQNYIDIYTFIFHSLSLPYLFAFIERNSLNLEIAIFGGENTIFAINEVMFLLLLPLYFLMYLISFSPLPQHHICYNFSRSYFLPGYIWQNLAFHTIIISNLEIESFSEEILLLSITLSSFYFLWILHT